MSDPVPEEAPKLAEEAPALPKEGPKAEKPRTLASYWNKGTLSDIEVIDPETGASYK